MCLPLGHPSESSSIPGQLEGSYTLVTSWMSCEHDGTEAHGWRVPSHCSEAQPWPRAVAALGVLSTPASTRLGGQGPWLTGFLCFSNQPSLLSLGEQQSMTAFNHQTQSLKSQGHKNLQGTLNRGVTTEYLGGESNGGRDVAKLLYFLQPFWGDGGVSRPGDHPLPDHLLLVAMWCLEVCMVLWGRKMSVLWASNNHSMKPW